LLESDVNITLDPPQNAIGYFSIGFWISDENMLYGETKVYDSNTLSIKTVFINEQNFYDFFLPEVKTKD